MFALPITRAPRFTNNANVSWGAAERDAVQMISELFTSRRVAAQGGLGEVVRVDSGGEG